MEERDMPETEQQSERCETCRYYRVIEIEQRTFRQCHRFPPIPLSGRFGGTAWPDVSPKDWCGEYEAAVSA